MPLSKPRDKTVRAVLARSGNQCAYPGCTRSIFGASSLSGQLSHIKGNRPGSARYDPSQTPDERHGEANLLAMCHEHGTLIDSYESAANYPVLVLRQMKIEHEQTMERRADRSWIKPPNAISGGSFGDTPLHYWIDRNGKPQVYSDEQLAKLNALLHLSIDISNLSTTMNVLRNLAEPTVKALLQQSYARVGEGESSLYAHLVKLIAVAPEITFGEFLHFVVDGGDATPVIDNGAKRLQDAVAGREPFFWRQKKSEH